MCFHSDTFLSFWPNRSFLLLLKYLAQKRQLSILFFSLTMPMVELTIYCTEVSMLTIMLAMRFAWWLCNWNFKFTLSNCIKQKCIINALFSSPDTKGHVSYCHHLASVVRRELFQKSSPLKVLDQWKPNLVWIITRVSSLKIVSGDVHQPSWQLLLNIW